MSENHWPMVPLRRIADVVDCAHVTAEFVDDDDRFPIASIRECGKSTVDLSGCNYTTQEFFEALRASGRVPRVGDLLFIRNVSVGLVSVVAPGTADFAVGQETVLLRRSNEVEPGFLRYALTAQTARHAIEGAMIGSTFRRVNVSAIRALPVPIPTIEQQRTIADYLDHETAQIDTLIAEQWRLIELLRERRASFIDSVITTGLQPEVETKDSGVSWIGHVPAHWTVRPLWSMFRRVKDIDHPEEQMLSVFRDYGVVAKNSRDNINQTAENRSIYQLVHPGWLVANRMKAWQGSVGISSLRGIVSGHYICFEPRHPEDHDYLNWLFRSARYATGYALISRGVRIGQAEIDNDGYRVLPVVVPPIDEQRAISAHLGEQTTKIDALIAETERFIDLARERRSALITAAVTGQIDVRGEVA